ncbi:hypothetical protein LTR36_005480 [Oleoguttula mirabilis]|uniref:Uncharacterized protein n=1 Tax=Oleoguttula mirabilis TaxID=1507867 RepID=A0AAV9JED4_9PEZI|nr:hypothetical protein LTR36_005480 [Oleoguttula mirabilis]
MGQFTEAAKRHCDFALQLVFYLMPGRTVWQYMTEEQHTTLFDQAAKFIDSQTGGTHEATGVIAQILPLLKNVHFTRRFRMPDDIDNYAYDRSLISRTFIRRTLNKLWAMVLSGVTFRDAPEEGSDAIAVMRDVIGILKQSLELTTKAEILGMAKMLWPRVGFESFPIEAPSLKSFYEDLNDQLMADGLLVEKEGWVECSAWANDLENFWSFDTSALPQKRYGGALTRVPDSMSDLPTETVVVNGTRIQIPIVTLPAPEVAQTAQTLSGLAMYQQSMRSTEEATEHLKPPTRQVSPMADDIAYVRQTFEQCRQRVFDAMVTLPADADDWQKKQWVKVQSALEKGTITLACVEAASWVIVEEAVKVHERGVSLPKKDDLGLKSPIDNNIRCSERMEAIIRILLQNKLVCLGVFDRHSILCFVAAPKATFACKERSHKVTATPQQNPQLSNAAAVAQ